MIKKKVNSVLNGDQHKTIGGIFNIKNARR